MPATGYRVTKGPFLCAPGPQFEGLPVADWFTPIQDLHERSNILFGRRLLVSSEEWGKPCRQAKFSILSNKNQAPRWWCELEILSPQWRDILCHQVFNEGCTRYGGRECFLRVVYVNDQDGLTATSSTTPATASTSKAMCFIYKWATRERLYDLLAGSTMADEPVTLSPTHAGVDLEFAWEPIESGAAPCDADGAFSAEDIAMEEVGEWWRGLLV